MRTTTLTRALVAAGTAAGLLVAGITAATARPAGYPGTPEPLDWPNGPIIKPVPPPDSGDKPEGPLPEAPQDDPPQTPSTTRG